MKKARIGIFGKTLFFTCILVLIISTLIVGIFSSMFLQYANKTYQLEQENQRAKLINSLQNCNIAEAQDLLWQYKQKNNDDIIFLIDSSGDTVNWQPEYSSTFLTKFKKVNPEKKGLIESVESQLTPNQVEYLYKQIMLSQSVVFYSNKKTLDLLHSKIDVLQKQWMESNESITVFLKNIKTKYPDINYVILPSSLESNTNNNNIFLDNPEMEDWLKKNFLFDTKDDSEKNSDKSEEIKKLNLDSKYDDNYAEISLEEEQFQLLIRQLKNNPESLRSLGEILLRVIGISIIPTLAGSFLFAKWLTGPIKRLATATRKMASRESVKLEKISKDEMGDLTCDVFLLYSQLSDIIKNREQEMQYISQMEANQREFFLAASHELKTPVAAISALMEGMLDGVGDYSNHPKYLLRGMKTAEIMNRLISEILEIVRLEKSDESVDMEAVCLSDLLCEKRALYDAIAECNNQDLKIELPDKVVYTDINRFTRALDNIIINALQNTKSNKQIKIWSETDKQTLILKIWNEGAHIPKDQLAHVFEPFYRIEQVRSLKNNHSGLGLTITKRLLESMKIPFELKNVQDGVLFSLELQLK